MFNHLIMIDFSLVEQHSQAAESERSSEPSPVGHIVWTLDVPGCSHRFHQLRNQFV